MSVRVNANYTHTHTHSQLIDHSILGGVVHQPPSTHSSHEMRRKRGLWAGHAARTARTMSNTNRMRFSRLPPYSSVLPSEFRTTRREYPRRHNERRGDRNTLVVERLQSQGEEPLVRRWGQEGVEEVSVRSVDFHHIESGLRCPSAIRGIQNQITIDTNSRRQNILPRRIPYRHGRRPPRRPSLGAVSAGETSPQGRATLSTTATQTVLSSPRVRQPKCTLS